MAGVLLFPGAVFGQSSLQQLIDAKPSESSAASSVGLVRRSILTEAAMRLGTQAGLADRAKIIVAEIKRREVQLDARYRFQALIMDAALLPPVIVETRDAVALDTAVMRVAKATFRIVEPPRFVDVAPTWRDWLYLGLVGLDAPVAVEPEAAPKTPGERELWEKDLRAAYLEGERQAQRIFEVNLATLNRAYDGMRTYYDLYARKMVSAPVLVAATDVATMDDPSTMVVGSTIFRVTVNPRFVDDAREWVPLGK